MNVNKLNSVGSSWSGVMTEAGKVASGCAQGAGLGREVESRAPQLDGMTLGLTALPFL